MIVEREEEIEAFVPREYWTAEAQLAHRSTPFNAKLIKLDGKKFEQFTLTNATDAEAARARLIKAAGDALHVSDVQSRERKRRPAPPFITSTLQQEAARKLGFTTSRTMRVAQKLYEGVSLGEQGTVGLISYMRTDSTHLSQEAVAELREVIASEFGPHALPAAANEYRTKSKNAQEAHEAIRPTSAKLSPRQVATFLNADEAKLYELIWKRTVACQMIPATLNTVSVDLAAGREHGFRASGTTVVDPGFLAVYEEGTDQKSEDAEDEGRKLPAMKAGDVVPLAAIVVDQHFTEPPPRFSEASLVKALEEFGIGRPSTYASIIQTLQSREYVVLDNRRFLPSDVGRAVAKFLSGHFTQYVDYDFTAKLEDELDAVSRGEEDWVPLMHRFWKPFKALVSDKIESVDKSEATGARVLGMDPSTGLEVSVRLGRFGPYAAIGNKDDVDKPKFASLRAGQSMHTITLEQALDLFRLPRTLGEYEGVELTIGVGRFGPFVKHAGSYTSLKASDDPYEIDLPRAIELIEEKRQAAANRLIKKFDGTDIEIVNGRFGPYITDGKKNGKIPKGSEPSALSLAECQQILEAAPERGGKRGGFARKGAAKSDASTAPAKKSASKKATAKKAPAKKAAAKKASAKSAAKKATTRKVASDEAPPF